MDVTGVKPSINNQNADSKIIIGTLGNADIEKLVKKKEYVERQKDYLYLGTKCQKKRVSAKI
ncbi:MAG: hypothetical protein J6Y24_00870 [Bacteroidales bacterium]|nr:hypothetical protein [Bacteroidales bacterium]